MAKRKNKHLEASPPVEPSKLFTNLLKTARQYILGRSYAPLSSQEIMQKLGLPEQHSSVFGEVVKTLVNEGSIKLKHGVYHCQDSNEAVVTGMISMHPRGFGFVKQDEPSDEGDIFIPKHLTLNAVDGDHVEVAINTDAPSDKGPEGKVLAILSRSRTHIAGIITQVSSYGETLAYVPLLGTAQRIVVQPSDQFDLKEGDRVVMKVLEWGSKENDTECNVSHYLGHISDPACDIAAAIEEYELLSEFPSKVLKEAENFGSQVARSDFDGREDLRHLECFTIDPTTAKDFDDALTLSKDEKGHYHLIVHIADVSHYVKEGSAIDKEASKRCNSTYFPGMCLPMLPRALSENLCSLKANVNRLAVSVSMHFDSEGNLQSHQIFRSVIKSSMRFTYNDAKEVLDGKKRSKHAPTLRLMVELCKLLKVKRFERGSLEFALPDLVIKVDSNGVPLGTEYVSYDVTHQMVEEFMLKANETVAQHLDKQGKHLAYRIHDEPSEENMKDFSILANAFGFNLPEIPQPQHLQKLFDEALETPYGQYLAVSYIRRMRQALYSPENIGHYGLGLTHYCHFTSPIRRYVDLVVHRSIFEDALDFKRLDLIAKQSSEQERISAKAENHVSLLKKLRLLDKIYSETPYKQYEAVITRVKNFGFSFEVLDFLLEGFLHVSELEQDYFIFDEKRMQLFGRRTNRVYSSGERITVMLKSVNFIQLESKWNLVSEQPLVKSGHRGQKRHKERGSQRRRLKGQKPVPVEQVETPAFSHKAKPFKKEQKRKEVASPEQKVRKTKPIKADQKALPREQIIVPTPKVGKAKLVKKDYKAAPQEQVVVPAPKVAKVKPVKKVQKIAPQALVAVSAQKVGKAKPVQKAQKVAPRAPVVAVSAQKAGKAKPVQKGQKAAPQERIEVPAPKVSKAKPAKKDQLAALKAPAAAQKSTTSKTKSSKSELTPKPKEPAVKKVKEVKKSPTSPTKKGKKSE